MRRREFIKVIAASVTAWPIAAHAQQAPIPVVGGFALKAAGYFYYDGRSVFMVR